MKYRAVIKKSDEWWIGWLVDLPGVNAQEKTREKLIESLRSGAQEMLTTEVPFACTCAGTSETEGLMTTIEVPPVAWMTEATTAFRSLSVPATDLKDGL